MSRAGPAGGEGEEGVAYQDRSRSLLRQDFGKVFDARVLERWLLCAWEPTDGRDAAGKTRLIWGPQQ